MGACAACLCAALHALSDPGHVCVCSMAGGPGCMNGVRHPPKIVTHLYSLREMLALCGEWNLLIPGEKHRSVDVLKERWKAFTNKAKTSRDRVNISGCAPDYQAAAREVMREVRGRALNSPLAPTLFPVHGSAANGRAVGKAAGGGGHREAGADAAFDRLIENVRARGYKGGPPPDWEPGAAEGGSQGDEKRRRKATPIDV